MESGRRSSTGALSWIDVEWEERKMSILHGLCDSYPRTPLTLRKAYFSTQSLFFKPTPCEFAARLCRWGFFGRSSGLQSESDQRVDEIATEMARQISDKDLQRLWDLSCQVFLSEVFKHDTNPLAIYFRAEARKAYELGEIHPSQSATWDGQMSNSINDLPRQPDRKVCMTCGGQVDGVIYCSEQCRPSASLDWYSHNSDRAETPTMSAGFRTARSRFLSPSADSQATFNSTQIVPPPYGLVDANPPTPKFVPIKIETLEEEHVEVMVNSSGMPNSRRLPPIIPGILKHGEDRPPPWLPTDWGRSMKLPWILDAPPEIAQFDSEPSIARYAFGWNCFHVNPFISCGICEGQGQNWEEESVIEEYMKGFRQRDVGLLAAQARLQ